MANLSNANKHIAKNTVFLYIRMIVVMLIGFYTSRVLLQNLGVDDFGIYGVVGGIVSMFASLKTMFTTATQRFLNIELGRGDKNELNKVFNISILVNLCLAFLFFIVVEVGGSWLLENKLNIEPDRMIAARWVFQFSVISSLISIMNSPYTADIIAHEKMDFFAIISIFDAIARLSIVLMLPYLGGDRLIVYGALLLVIVSLNLLIDFIYCRINFPESRIRRFSYNTIRDKFKEMFAFSGWTFFGNMVFTLVNEGINVLLNIFGSVVANAARTVSYQVKGAISNVVSNVYTAIKPQAIQSYARNDISRFYKLLFTGGKIVGYMYILMAIPLYFSLEVVLQLWLGTVPEYAVAFLSACLVYQFVRVLHESINTYFVTIGKLRDYQLTELIVQGLALPLAYVGLKFFNMPLYGVFIVMAFMELMNLIAILLLAKKIGGFDIMRFTKSVLLPYGIMSIICFLSVFIIKMTLSYLVFDSMIKALVLVVISVIVEILELFFIGMKKEERELIVKMIKR